MQDQNEPVPLPEIAFPHIVKWWLEIGPSHNDGPIDWQEMRAWQESTGIELSPWEARIIRSLSAEYVNMRYEARKLDCPAPYSEIDQSTRDIVSAKLDAAFASLKKA